jgi:hypothetical protein
MNLYDMIEFKTLNPIFFVKKFFPGLTQEDIFSAVKEYTGDEIYDTYRKYHVPITIVTFMLVVLILILLAMLIPFLR